MLVLNDFIDESVGERLSWGHVEIPIGIHTDFVDGLITEFS